jgi:flagellar hook-associated protein 3 FlgL
MSILPTSSGSSLVSNLLRSDVASQQLASTQQQLLTVENQLSTGLAINTPSDNPSASAVIMQLQKSLDQNKSYSSNITNSQSQLSEVDSTLGNVTTLITQAQSIASANVGTTESAAQRQAAATVVQSLYNQALSLSNTQFEGSYIFGGDNDSQPPFVQTDGGVKFTGSNTVLSNTDQQDLNVAFQTSAASVFGSPGQATGGDLSPALTPTTLISSLNGAAGDGVSLGSIVLGDGTNTAAVDLSTANTIQDVVSDINAASFDGVTASISGNHLVLSSPSANLTVKDSAGGSTAADLGILQTTGAGAGVSITGSSVQPQITDLTPLSALNGGAGIDTTHGMVITNGSQSATINLSGATTVQDLLNAINGAGVNVQAQINSDGTGINVLNLMQGTGMTISENGGTTAADLGLRSLSPSTPLSELNNGKGVGTASGGGNDFTITAASGGSFAVDLTGATTIQDVLNQINADATTAGVAVTASFNTTTNGVVLTDNTTGAGKLTVAADNYSTAATDLGLTAPAVGNTITGTDVNPITTNGLFTDLANLQSALESDNVDGINAAAAGLTNDANLVNETSGVVGARVQEMQNQQSAITTANTATQTLMSNLQDTDYTTAVTQFQTLQNSLQAALETTARVGSLTLLDYLY